MSQVIIIALAVVLLLAASYLMFVGRREEESGPIGVAWTLVVAAIALLAYGFINPPSAG